MARTLEKNGYRVGVLSGDVPQKKRESLLKKFQAGQLELLVATDVAARGLHIDGVSHVFNYDLPFDAEDYVHRIGRTARLGAEGDAISFACERYAMSLPDIEAYIEQKIPSEPVTAELLTALPRAPKPQVEAVAEEGESIGEIFKEVREARAAEDAKRGGGRSRSGGGERRGERSGGGRSGDGESRGPRRRRKPQGEAVADAVAGQNPVPAQAAAAAAPATAPAAEGERPARKRRRRRGGRKLDGNDAAQAPAAAAAAPRTQEKVAVKQGAGRQDDKPSLLGRISRGLKSLVTRGPSNQH